MNNPLLELLLVMLAMLIWAGEVVVNEYWMHIPRTGWSMLAPGVTNYCEINPTKEKGNWPRSEMTQAEIDEFDAIYERVDDVRDRYRPLFRRQPNRNLIASLLQRMPTASASSGSTYSSEPIPLSTRTPFR